MMKLYRVELENKYNGDIESPMTIISIMQNDIAFCTSKRGCNDCPRFFSNGGYTTFKSLYGLNYPEGDFKGKFWFTEEGYNKFNSWIEWAKFFVEAGQLYKVVVREMTIPDNYFGIEYQDNYQVCMVEPTEDDIVFLHTEEYNNETAKREIPFSGIHAWAVRVKDIVHFLKVYPDVVWSEVSTKGLHVYTMDFDDVNNYVCNDSIYKQDCICVEEFKKDHCVWFSTPDIREGWEGFWDGTLVCNNPYQVLITSVPIPTVPNVQKFSAYVWANLDKFVSLMKKS